MSTSFYLVRHGQKTSQFEAEAVLTPLGHEQARQTGVYFSGLGIGQIMSSPARRAQETAHDIGQVLGLTYTVTEQLTERLLWTDKNMSAAEFLQEWNRSCDDPNYQPLFGDSARASGERGQKFLTQVLAQADGQKVIFVAHSGIISDIIRAFFGRDDPRLQTHEYCFRGSANCGISQIDFTDDGPHLIQLNFTDHLREVTY
ncbi:histidine phosphatase family protein [bacterium]|nr:histidine phosphatase family protein [bacterium]